ncbi:MAG: alpha-2-macroglobulin [Myxococcota bacterium]
MGRKIEDAPIQFEPPIEGIATWKTTQELRFLPAAPLESGARYRAKITLAELEKADKADKADNDNDNNNDEPFTFNFSVLKQDFEVRIDELTSDAKDKRKRALQGTVTTVDHAPGPEVEKLLLAEYEGEAREITWAHHANGKNHRFVVPSLERGDEARELTLRWDGGAIGVVNQGDYATQILAVGEFKVTRARSSVPDGLPLLISFSDNLDPKQNLSGMIRVAGREVRSEVDGNLLRVYPPQNTTGEVQIEVSAGIRNTDGRALAKSVTKTVTVEARKPAVRFVGQGVVLPTAEHLTVPIEAVAVRSVQVTAFRVYDENLGRFLQDNQLDGNSQMHRVGRHLWRKTIQLEPEARSGWERYSLDLTELLGNHRGSLLRLSLSLNRGNSTYTCPDSDIPPVPEKPFADYNDSNAVDRSNWDGWEGYNQPSDYRDRKNPCKDAYFRFASGVRDSRNFLASDIGLLAKQGDATDLHVIATDLRDTAPLGDVSIEVFNYQNQSIGEAQTDGDGMARIALAGAPFYLQAKRGDERAVLKLTAGTALATSHFEVGGAKLQEGRKGFIYGERGVWRPGDAIHLTFVAHDTGDGLPASHPVTLTLSDPRGQKIATETNDAPVGGFYRFDLETAEDAPTGVWQAEARLGGAKFSMPVRVETVIPNRLKAEFDFGAETLTKSAMPLQASIFGQWLHGADASGLKVALDARLRARPTRFARNSDFVFDDPTRKVRFESKTLFEGSLDETGRVSFPLDMKVEKKAAGQLNAELTTRVFEESGAFSTERLTIPFHPYDRYVGLRTPPGDRARGMLLTDEDHALEIATLSAEGEPVSVEEVDVRLYKLDWRWWWDKSGESLAQYSTATNRGLVSEGTVSTTDGVGKWSFRINEPEWGRYLLRACDTKGGHCSGKIVYLDWPGWAGRAQEQGGVGATALTLTSDRDSYNVGESARITLPVASKGRMLVSVETGSEILSHRWIEVEAGDNAVEIPISAEMAPTAYVSVVLLQPHAGKDNDRPIRLYGYLPLSVEDPDTRLDVLLTAPEEIRPLEPTQIEVKEASGLPMTYTVAIVDEGLLGLTRYGTPSLHDAFFAREALGIRTWDLFDYVAGAYEGELDRLLAIGGGASNEPAEQQKAKRRFPPIVEFLGPFTLAANATGTHEFELPEYIGAVRVMIVAGGQGAYGSTEKSVFVRDKVMALATLPRVLGPSESVALPVAVFVTDPEIQSVDVSVRTDEMISVSGTNQNALAFKKPGDQITNFDLEVGEQIGLAHVHVQAEGHGERASQEIAIEVRNPNRETLRQVRETIEPGAAWQSRVEPHGLPGTESVGLEVSSVPPLNLERRLEYLVRYPYGCVEQTTSAAFPQLFVPSLARLNPKQAEEIQTNVVGAIDRLRSFQRPDGSFSYWPGGHERHDWATSYAGHFLVEATKQGYHVPVGMIEDWADNQRSVVQNWVAGGSEAVFEQAYRLYTLALAGKAEVGAMNRLRESDALQSRSRWMLASAYQAAGVSEAAEALVAGDEFSVTGSSRGGRTFGTRLRSESIFLVGAVALERFDLAERWVERLSAGLASDKWHSTQSTAWALLAMSRYVGAESGKEAFAVEVKREELPAKRFESDLPILRMPLEDFSASGETLKVENKSQRRLYATVSTRGVPRLGKEVAAASGLRLEVNYEDLAGKRISPEQIAQGRDFVANVTVINTRDRTVENLALTQIVPSGWEIHDADFVPEDAPNGARAAVDYRNVRDDRIYSYFKLEGGKRKTFRVLLNAAYRGRFYLPPIRVEAMYDAETHALAVGRWVEVVGIDAQ